MPFPASLWFCGMRTTDLRPSRRRDSRGRCKAPDRLLWISCLYIRGRNGLQLPNWTPIEPNLNLPIIRSATLAFTSATSASHNRSCGCGQMFNQDASSNDKDLLRPSLRSKVSALGAALKSQKRNAIVPSAPQSECSTLVDFAIEDVLLKEDSAVEFETEDYMLDADNSAWATGKFSISPSPKKHKAARATVTVPPSQTHVLDSENTAWATARPTASQPVTKSRTRFFGSGRPALRAPGVEPEYLDPEDRAWM
ncbi:hypothetical protein GSI_05955 [Ganoderma sinense ZZ0214-1]|uniref:Uncharacterized protein n=1 Tax=Ganoderma sinense ZZ0214-1 TaxID=1077348 RepID=A0A2G8SBW6_9APHY|nr:hypothetical protein GSI_05955 [Ganoderma sinense ZZ0214-1]